MMAEQLPTPLNNLPAWNDLSRITIGSDAQFGQAVDEAKKRPPELTLKLARMIARTAVTDPALRKFGEFSWGEIIDCVADHVKKNQDILSRFDIDSPDLEPVADDSTALNRAFAQLPCTKSTADSRVAMAKQICQPGDPILLLGDDDMVSIALAKAGFTNIKAVDIDTSVIAAIAARARRERLPIALFHHDLSDEPNAELIGNHKLIFMDPAYSVEGISLFMTGALKMLSPGAKPHIFLSVHLMSLGEDGIEWLRSYLEDCQFDLIEVRPGFNAYPVPAKIKSLIRFLHYTVIRSKAFRAGGSALPFFTSDALLLKKR